MRPETDPWIARSCWYEATLRAGCQKFSVVLGHYYPTVYGDPMDEYEALTTGVTLWDVPSENPVRISGPNATTFLDWAQTRDVSRHRVGRCRYSLFVNRAGGILFDTVILRPEENVFYVNGPREWIRGLADGAGWDGVEIADTSIYPLQLQGPRAIDVMRRLAGEAAAELPFFGLIETEILGVPFYVSRTGWSGEAGFELYCRDNSRADELWDHVLEVGSDAGLRVTASSEMRRVEAGILNLGVDLTPDLNPWGAGLGRLVDLDRPGDFVGKDALRRLSDQPPTRRVTGIVFDGDPAAAFEETWPVLDGEKEVGRCTVATLSPALGCHIGYVNLPGALAAEGTTLTVLAPTGPIGATTRPFPFVDAERKRMKA